MSRRRRPRLYYLAPVAVGRGIGHRDIPAVRNKVLGVCAAVRAAGAAAVLVTPVAPARDVGFGRPMRAARVDRVPAVQVLSRGRYGVHRLVSLVTLMLAVARVTRRGDRVVLYNFFPEYLLAALWLRLVGISCVIDIEDAPRGDERGVRGMMVRWSFKVLRVVAERRFLVASERLAHELGLTDFLAVYGVASHFTAIEGRSKPFSGPAIRINLGGALLRETGVDMFIAALRILVRDHGDKPLHFFLTGNVPSGLFDQLAAEVNASLAMRFTVAANLEAAAYRALLDTMDVGLCLKLPSSSMGQTTFPSKVVEIAAMGLMLVTTPVSDVPLIFDDQCAVLLRSEVPEELAAVLAALPNNRTAAAECARGGQERVRERFSAAVVGAAIRAFLKI